MKKQSIILIVLCLYSLTACTSQKVELNYDKELASFLISKPATYYGEGQYYHEIQSVEVTESQDQYTVDAKGEIRDNYVGSTPVDYTFSYHFYVDDQSIVQILDNNRLNDSEFKKIELLRKPISIGATWSFDAVMFNNKSTKMTAEILNVNEAKNEVIVRYTARDYLEERVLKKEIGVTDFIKEVSYKEVKAISGFHQVEEKEDEKSIPSNFEVEVSEVESEEKAFLDFIEVTTTQKEHDLILGFNQNFEKKISLEDDNLTDYVMPESPASEKISNLKAEDVGTFSFIKFKVKSKTEVGDSSIIEVVEMYDLGEAKSFFNTVTYTIKMYGDQLMVYDFK